MFRVALVNMPFAAVNRPSLGLTQLQARLEQVYSGEVDADVHYCNLDFARQLGLEHYRSIAEDPHHHSTGIGDWLFRQIAFPDAPDNTDAYFRRHYPQTQWASFRGLIAEQRRALLQVLATIIDSCQLDRYDVVGFTSMFAQNVASIAMARLLKERSPGVVTIMGGPNCEAPMGRPVARNIDAIDFVFSGPGLQSGVEFVGHLLAGDRERCHQVPGVLSARNLAGQLDPHVVGPELDIDTEIPLDYRPFLERLAAVFPDQRVSPHLLFETSRGCWWGERSHCTFCGLNGSTMNYRAMRPELAIRQFERLFEYCPPCASFSCVDNILPRSYLTDVLPHVRPPRDATIFYEVKADLSDEDVEVLARSGVRLIQPGIESLATPILKLMGKGTTSFQNVRLLKSCLQHGISPGWNLLIGFPGEDPSVYPKYLTDLADLVHLPPPSGTYPVRFDRYSPYFTRAGEYGLDLAPFDHYVMTYPFEDSELSELAYYFVDRRIGQYALNAGRWYGPLTAAIARWREAWFSEARPVLQVEAGSRGAVVRDTRFGEVRVEPVTSLDLRLLAALTLPRRPAEVVALVEDPGLAERRLDELAGRRYLFREGERVLSLVTNVPGLAPDDPVARPRAERRLPVLQARR